MWATRCPSLTSPPGRRLAMTAHGLIRPQHFTRALPLSVGRGQYHPKWGGSWHGHGLDHRTFPAYGLKILAQVGLLMGTLLLVLLHGPVARPAPDLPSPVARPATRSPGVFALGSDPFLLLTRLGDRPATVLTRRVAPPHESFALDDDLDEDIDDPAALAVLTARTCGHPLAPARQGIADVTSVHLWPSRFLLRPQLLTRL